MVVVLMLECNDDCTSTQQINRLKGMWESSFKERINKNYKIQDKLMKLYFEFSNYVKKLRSEEFLIESMVNSSLSNYLLRNELQNFPNNLLTCINDILPTKDLFFINPRVTVYIYDYCRANCEHVQFNSLQYFYNTKTTKYLEYLDLLKSKTHVFSELAVEDEFLEDNDQSIYDYCGAKQKEYYELITLAIQCFPDLENHISQRIFTYEPAFWLYFERYSQKLENSQKTLIEKMFRVNVKEICKILGDCDEYTFEYQAYRYCEGVQSQVDLKFIFSSSEMFALFMKVVLQQCENRLMFKHVRNQFLMKASKKTNTRRSQIEEYE